MTIPRAVLSLRITVDHDDSTPGRPAAPVYSTLKLYREDGALVWRIGGPLGDVCETLPAPSSVESAKADARAVYRVDSTWEPHASWL